jgi:hypothetical protein
MDYIYIINEQRTRTLDTLHGIWTNYPDAIKAYYELNHIGGGSGKHIRQLFFKFPANQIIDEKFGKSSEYRVVFKDYEELELEYKKTNRISKINDILNDSL